MPAPPAVIREPVMVDVEFVVALNDNDPAFIKVDPDVLENVMVVPVVEVTTRPMYNELPLRYKSANGFEGEPSVIPVPVGRIGPPIDSDPNNSALPNIVAVVPTIKFLATAAPPAACKAFV